MDPLLATHLKQYGLTTTSFRTLMRKMLPILSKCATSSELIQIFANKFYSAQSDKIQAAKCFLEHVFGSIDTLLNEGPVTALEIVLYGKAKNLIKVEKIFSRRSCHGVHLREPETIREIEEHPRWTRRFNHYLVGPTLGEGGTAKVKLAWDLTSKRKVAIKIMSPELAWTAMFEIGVHRILNHKNILQIYSWYDNIVWDKKRTTIAVIEYADYGDVFDYIYYTSKFDDKLARWLFHGLVEAVEYCHERQIVHRDLKLANCLIGKDFLLKVADFGFAKHCVGNMRTKRGTGYYMAPEIIQKRRYTNAVDIFSMGVMLFITLVGTKPWNIADSKDKVFSDIHHGRWDKFFKYHERAHKFESAQKIILKGMLEPDPEKRWKLKEVKRCRWFRGRKLSQKDVEVELLNRKKAMDIKIFTKMRPGARVDRKSVNIFSQKLPYVYFQPAPLLSFITCQKADWVLEDIAKAICGLKGTIKVYDKEKYKLTFNINVITNRKLGEKVQVVASVQMWTLQGQRKALEDRAKALEAGLDRRRSWKNEQKQALVQNIPKIKSIAVFRAKGDSEVKRYFTRIYSDILVKLPANIIYKDAYMTI